MSSRLFQEIREKKGLAYAVYSYFSSYFDAGVFAVYLGVGKDTVQEAVSLVIAELNKCRENGIEESELQTAKEHLKGNLSYFTFSMFCNNKYLAHLYAHPLFFDDLDNLAGNR